MTRLNVRRNADGSITVGPINSSGDLRPYDVANPPPAIVLPMDPALSSFGPRRHRIDTSVAEAADVDAGD